MNELERDSDGEFERFVCVVEYIVRVLYAPTSGGSVDRSVMATRGFGTEPRTARASSPNKTLPHSTTTKRDNKSPKDKRNNHPKQIEQKQSQYPPI